MVFSNIILADIITLVRVKERYENVSKYLSENKNWKIFPAVDKQDKERLESLRKKYSMNITKGNKDKLAQTGCALSHILVLEKFLKSISKYHIIMEDDIDILREMPKTTEEVDEIIESIGQTYDSTDIIYLSDRVQCDDSYRVNNGCGLEGYLVTRHGAKKLLSIVNKNLNNPIDLAWQGHYGINRTNDDGLWCYKERNPNINISINAFKTKIVYVGQNSISKNTNIKEIKNLSLALGSWIKSARNFIMVGNILKTELLDRKGKGNWKLNIKYIVPY